MAATRLAKGEQQAMKFSDGFWRMRPGVTAWHPAEAYDICESLDALTVYAPTRKIEHRGHTLGGPLVTIRLTSPLPDVVCVRLSHFEGEVPKKPEFAIASAPGPVVVSTSDEAAELTAGSLTARVDRNGEWRISFEADGRVLTSSEPKGIGIVETEGHHYMVEQLGLGVGECVYGLGERFGPLVKNGQSVDIWNRDGGTSSEQAYKNIPFYLTDGGYGVFVSDPGRVSFEVGSEAVSRVQFSVEGHALEYYVIYGPTPKEILEKYTSLTGRPALPPAWSFGLWLSTSFTTAYDEATVMSFIRGMAERHLPMSVFHFDSFWMREFNWCDFAWDPRTFPDPKGMLARLKADGLRVSLWINPYIAQRSPLFEEGRAAGYLLKRPNGDVWQWDLWQPGMGLVDFTNPEARRWYASKLDALLDMGVDCFKTDFGERIPTDVAYFDGSDPERMHNYYPYLYNRTVFELLEKRRGKGEAVVFARSATAGTQQFPVHWGGDCSSTFESMAESLRGGLSLGLSGFGFWSHDIGGFEGTPPASVFKRWIAFGLLSSHSRLHANESYRVPWLFDEEAVEVMRTFTELKNRLMPYLYGAAVEAHERGIPTMRAMCLEFPDDPGCAYLDRQYMLGERLLVAPVFSEDGTVSYYVPAGRWTNLLSGAVVEGPGWREEQHPCSSLPLLVRPNTVLPMGECETRADYDFRAGVTLQAYAIEDGAQVRVAVPSQAGEPGLTFELRRRGKRVTVTPSEAAPGWRLLLLGETVESASGGTVEATAEGSLVTPSAPDGTMELTLRASR
jgi:alpha-D-xyloside xylohydrolase